MWYKGYMILSSRSKGLLKGGWIAVLLIALWGACNYEADVIYTMDQLKQEDAAPSEKDAGKKKDNAGIKDTAIVDTGVEEDSGVVVEDVGVEDTGVVDTGTNVEPVDSGGIVDSGHAPDRDATVGRGIEIPEGFILNPTNAEANWICAAYAKAGPFENTVANCQLFNLFDAINTEFIMAGVVPPFILPFDTLELSISIEYPWTEGPDAIIFTKGVMDESMCTDDAWWFFDIFSFPPSIRLCQHRCEWYRKALQQLNPEDIMINVGYLCLPNPRRPST